MYVRVLFFVKKNEEKLNFYIKNEEKLEKNYLYWYNEIDESV